VAGNRSRNADDGASEGVTGGPVLTAAKSELRQANAHTTSAGAAALKLAELVDAITPSTTSPSSLVKEFRAAMAEALGMGTQPEADPIDELEAKRAERAAGGLSA